MPSPTHLCLALVCGTVCTLSAPTLAQDSPPASAPLNRHAAGQPVDGSPTFPDRHPHSATQRVGRPAVQFGPFTLDESQASYRSGSPDQQLLARLGYGRHTGTTFGFDFGQLIDAHWAWGINAAAGPRQFDLVVNGLYSTRSAWHLGWSAGYLRRTARYPYHSGAADTAVSQGSARLSLQRDFGEPGWLSDVGARIYLAQARTPANNERVMTEESATELRFLVDPRRLAPGRLTGFGLSLGLQPWPGARLKLGLGQESVRYRFLDGTGTRENRPGLTAELQQQFSNCWRLDAGVHTGVSGERYRLALAYRGLSLGLNRHAGRADTPGDTQLTLSYNTTFGDGSSRLSCGRTSPVAAQRGVNRLDEVARRPLQLPTTVFARVDPTARPFLLASIDKTALNGAEVSATPDALSITLPGPPALAVFSLSINGVAVSPTTTGLQGVPLVSITSDGRLHIAVRAFPSPGAGVSQPVEVRVIQPGQLAIVAFNVVGP